MIRWRCRIALGGLEAPAGLHEVAGAAVKLAERATLEETARLLWEADAEDPFAALTKPAPAAMSDCAAGAVAMLPPMTSIETVLLSRATISRTDLE